MTSLVSLLFISMTPTQTYIYKVSNFPYTCFFTFYNIINGISEPTHTASKERMALARHIAI